MTLFVYINQNIDRIKFDIKAGLVPCVILRHWQIYSRYDYYRKLGHEVSEAVLFTGEDNKVNERSVYYIIKKMEREI